MLLLVREVVYDLVLKDHLLEGVLLKALFLVVTENFLLDLRVRNNLRYLGSLARGRFLDAELFNTVGVDLEFLMTELVSSLVA